MTTSSKKFIVDIGWQALLRDLDLSAQDLLRYARLPLDLFSKESPALTTEEYYRLWDGLERMMGEAPAALHIGQAVSIESFSPPIFACLCSPNLGVALGRLAQYKPLIGPMRLDIVRDEQQTMVTIGGLPKQLTPPNSLIAMELVFLVHLTRFATREPITPRAVTMRATQPDAEAYADFFGTPVRHGDLDGLVFTAQDIQRPFLTVNESMWAVFEPELKKRMADLEQGAGFRERVRTCLLEILASGQFSMNDVADRLAVSTRTLQRRLREEGTTFQQELNSLREELAHHYLLNSRYSSTEIAFLLGYADPNSFIRAFHGWTGQPPAVARAELQYSA